MQNGDALTLADLDEFANATYKTELLSPCDGYIASSEASGIGVAAMMLGAGRSKKEDTIDHTAGIIQIKRVGDRVQKGSVIAVLQSSTVSDHSDAHKKMLESLTFSEEKPNEKPLVYEIIR